MLKARPTARLSGPHPLGYDPEATASTSAGRKSACARSSCFDIQQKTRTDVLSAPRRQGRSATNSDGTPSCRLASSPDRISGDSEGASPQICGVDARGETVNSSRETGLMKVDLGQWEALIPTNWCHPGFWHAPPLPLSGCFFVGHWFLGIIMTVVATYDPFRDRFWLAQARVRKCVGASGRTCRMLSAGSGLQRLSGGIRHEPFGLGRICRLFRMAGVQGSTAGPFRGGAELLAPILFQRGSAVLSLRS